MKKLLDGNHHNQRSALILKLLSFVAFTFFVLTIWLLYIDADLGLKVIWYYYSASPGNLFADSKSMDGAMSVGICAITAQTSGH